MKVDIKKVQSKVVESIIEDQKKAGAEITDELKRSWEIIVEKIDVTEDELEIMLGTFIKHNVGLMVHDHIIEEGEKNE